MAEQLDLLSIGPRSGIRVLRVWYLQPTARHEEIGKAAIRLATNLGEFYRDVDFSPEGLRSARHTARALGVDLVIAHDIREAIDLAGWESDVRPMC